MPGHPDPHDHHDTLRSSWRLCDPGYNLDSAGDGAGWSNSRLHWFRYLLRRRHGAVLGAAGDSVASTYTLGTANLKLRLGPDHVIKAVYGGVNGYLGSASSIQTITVTASSAAATSSEITSSGSAGNYTLSGKVTAYSSSAPTGSVSFLDQSNSNYSLGSAALDVATRTSGWQSLVRLPDRRPQLRRGDGRFERRRHTRPGHLKLWRLHFECADRYRRRVFSDPRGLCRGPILLWNGIG